ncbi:hypothetical protein CHS0354_020076 [Potamilus streckersoni]|uniref:Vacuolar protein sorting-associated protein 13B n=1 Tax=Potamilus streckersoni TaxID=2493646 RepID=A0AAE0VU94_9BIVA|nr:hypothetical protein CHS0354_020076 [Potamilus streckersoni]
MFKIESYIAPLLMGYVDKYIKLRPEDFQLSLWGGDVVLNNLDLRLDVIEKAIQLPIVFSSGHIHELRIHVPWTKLGSEPVVITINTIECILKLRDTAYSECQSSKSGESGRGGKSPNFQRAKIKQQADEDLPPGYLQSLMNKIINNVSIIVNNLIIKFVEDDIVLSVNAKSAECYSVNQKWDRTFVELSPSDLSLRRVVNFCDLTVCLDKRDASGRIEYYQDPLAYRCHVACRILMKYENIHGKFPTETKINLYCERLDLSLTDTQLPMFIRLVELCLALYYGTLQFPSPPEETMEPVKQNLQREIDKDIALGEAPLTVEEQGWFQWAWSFVPQLVPADEEEDTEGVENLPRKKQALPAIFCLGFCAYKLTIMFKLTEKLKEKVHYGPRKISFNPFLYLESEGISLAMLIKGLDFFDVQFGITNIQIISQGTCICEAVEETHVRGKVLLSGGEILQNKLSTNYLSQSLFDVNAPDNLGIPVDYILNADQHLQVYSEQFASQKFGFFFMDYLYTMEKKPQSQIQSSRSSDQGDLEEPVFDKEYSLSRFLIGPCHLIVNSNTVHRVQKVLDAAYRYDYEPYAKEKDEVVDDDRPQPAESQVKSMEEIMPTRTYHLTLFQPVISILSAEHTFCNVSRKSYKSKQKGKQRISGNQSQPDMDEKFPVFGLQLSATRFDLQMTGAMYPRKVVRLVSMIAGPSPSLLHHCYLHRQMKLFGFSAGLTKVDPNGTKSPLLTVIPPTSAALYTRTLLLSVYWKSSYLPRFEQLYELPQISVSLNKAGLHGILHIVFSWQQKNPKPADIMTNSLLDDLFPSHDSERIPHLPVFEIAMSGLEVKRCRTSSVFSYSGTISSIQAMVYSKDGYQDVVTPILHGSSNTEQLHNSEWLTHDESTLMDDRNDCFTFTCQLPKKQDVTEAPVLVLVNIEGICTCLDPVLSDWFSYYPRQKMPRVTDKGSKVEVDMVLAQAASPLQGNISQVSIASSGSTKQRSSSINLTHSATQGQITDSLPPPGATDKAAGDQEGDRTVDSIGRKLARFFPLLRLLQVQVEMKKFCIFVPKSYLHLSEPSMNIPRNLRRSLDFGNLADTFVLCLPHVQLQSAGLKPVPSLQEIPVTSIEGSLVGDKLPWNVCLKNFASYTIHCSKEALQIVKPVTVTCTIAVSHKYTPTQSENISALGLCLHTDMHAVTLSASHKQVVLIDDLVTKTLRLAKLVFRMVDDITTSLQQKSMQTNQIAQIKVQSSKSSSWKPKQSLISGPEYDGIYTETSGDITSLDTATSRELEIMEDTGGQGVKLSLWWQWTLPKCEFKLFLPGNSGTKDMKVSTCLEDITLAMDVQDVYTKVKATFGSVNVYHLQKSAEGVWQKGSYEGVLMNCHGELAKDIHILTTKLWIGDVHTAPSSCFFSSQSTREVSHGFFNLTFTRALCRNVKKRFQKLNLELPAIKNQKEGEFKEFYFHKYVSEICINVNPFDIVVCVPVIEALMEHFSDVGYNGNKRRQQQVPLQHGKSSHGSVAGLTSNSLPLIYTNLSGIRVFIPQVNGQTISERIGQIETTLDHDLLILQLQSLMISPQADNPLPRHPVERELYQRALQCGITNYPGSSVLDRQYQADIKSCMISTGCWKHFVSSLKPKHYKRPSSEETQIPALEWNIIKPSEKDQEIQLYPLLASCDVRIVAAPAVVYTNQSTQEDTLVCGYALELNVISDLDFHISVSQIQLLQHLCIESLKCLNSKTGFSENPSDVQDSKGSKNHDHCCIDSGVGSEISSLTCDRARPKTFQGRSVKESDDLTQNSKVITPFDVLLTAGRISCTVYSHKILKKVVYLSPEKIPESKIERKKSKAALEWQLSNTSAVSADEETGRSQVMNREMDQSYSSFNFMNIQKEEDQEVIPEGSLCLVPYLYIYLSQPYTLLSCQRTSQKFEICCYDMLVKGPSHDSILLVSETKRLPDSSDFMVYWLETKPGQPHPSTGIPPSLFTLKVINFLIEPATVILKLERPVKPCVSFSKIKHIKQFLEELFPVQSFPENLATEAQSTQDRNQSGQNIKSQSTQGRNHSGKHTESQSILDRNHSCQHNNLGFLHYLHHIDISTDQINLSIETKSCDKLPGIMASVGGMRINAGYHTMETENENRIICGAEIRDFYLKTCYYKRSLVLIGPSTITIDASFLGFHSNTSPPQCLVNVSTALMTVNIGQDHVLCLSLLSEHVQEFLQELVSSTDSSCSEKGKTKTASKADSSMIEDFILNSSEDDLKSGNFQYILDTAGSHMVAGPGEIIFCSGTETGNGTMTWCYRQPRVISFLKSSPLPFNVMNGQNETSTKVCCTLQYWHVLSKQFLDYLDFCLSETEPSTVLLPDVRAANSAELVLSQMWRIVIQQNIGEPLVQPASLAASLRIDSCFVPSLIPLIQIGASVDILDIRLSNHLSIMGQGTPSKLRPFYFTSLGPEIQEFACLKLENLDIKGIHWKGILPKLSVQFSSCVSLDILEYKLLTKQKVLAPFELTGNISILPYSKPPVIESDISCDPVFLRLGQGVIHTLTCVGQAWSQLPLLKEQSESEQEGKDAIIFVHFVLCNNTQHALRFGQVGTDENEVLQPREMQMYSWRSHRTKQQLHLCVDGKSWKWCEPFNINHVGTIVKCVRSPDKQCTFIIKVKSLSNTQKQVIIEGQLLITNRLTQNVDAKVITMTTESPSHRVVVGGEQTIPSFILEVGSIQFLKFRFHGHKIPWSQDVYITGDKMQENKLIKLSLPNKSTIHIWCRIFNQHFKGTSQTLVMLCPLYVVRSHLACPLYINVDTPKLDQHQQVEINGHGHSCQLQCIGGDLHHNLTFQFSPKSEISSSAVSLSTGLIDQLERTKLKEVDIDVLCNSWKTDLSTDWPYNQEERDGDPLSVPVNKAVSDVQISQTTHPSIDLSICLYEQWSGCNTVLVDVMPACLITNHCSIPVLLIGCDEECWEISQGQTFAPPKFEEKFSFGLRIDGEIYRSADIPISTEIVSSRRYSTDICSTLYLDNCVHTTVFFKDNAGYRAYNLAVQSSEKNRMRIITVKERFYLTNFTQYNLMFNHFTVPNNGGKVDFPANCHGEVLPCHLSCDKLTSDIQPLLSVPVIAPNLPDLPVLTMETTFTHYLSFRGTAPQGSEFKDSPELEWSYPVRLKTSEVGARMTMCVFVWEKEIKKCKPLCLSGHMKNDISYFVLRDDQAPFCLIKNNCSFPLVFGQTLMNLSLSGVVQEESELIRMLPIVLPREGEVYYTPPHINCTFPEINDKQNVPKIHLGGYAILSKGSQTEADHTLDDSQTIHWSAGIDLQFHTETFVTIPNIADVRVHIKYIAMVTHVTVEPITKADVSAKEIRSRLNIRETTYLMQTIPEKTALEKITEQKLSFSLASKQSVPKENSQVSRSLGEAEELRQSSFKISWGLFVKHFCFILNDEYSALDSIQELLRLSADEMFLAAYPASTLSSKEDKFSRTCYTCSVGIIQIDNQNYDSGKYDFPVVLERQDTEKHGLISSLNLDKCNILEKHAVLKSSSALHLQVVIATVHSEHTLIESVEISAKPMTWYVDDSFILRILKEVEAFIPTKLSHTMQPPVEVLKLPPFIKSISASISSPIRIQHVFIQPYSLLLSVHASIKLFIASDHTPLSFGKFEKKNICTTSHQLIRVIAMHYAQGALFRAGAVVGSLEILGNPTGLVRSIGTGMADFFRHPYTGLMLGPGAFLKGMSRGTTSLVKNISAGMLTSITNFASSVSRNMDRLSLDSSHQQRQEESRRRRPSGVSDGLKQGLTGFGLSLLGAIAGLADQPMQNFMAHSMADSPHSSRSTASSLVTGMGKGIVGVFTKPIGGAAEFLSQTSQGLLHGTGLSKFPKPKYAPQILLYEDATCGHAKYAIKLLQSLPSSSLICCMEAEQLDLMGMRMSVSLILTTDILFVVSHEDDAQQQAFAVAELECFVKSRDPPVMRIIWRDLVTFQMEENENANTNRVAAFIDASLNYVEPLIQEESASQVVVDTNLSMKKIQRVSMPQISMETVGYVPDCKIEDNEEISELPQFEERHLSDCKSEDSNSSQMETVAMTMLPQYDFHMTAAYMEGFMEIFNLVKSRLTGKGFDL